MRSARDLYELAVENPRQLRSHRDTLETHLRSDRREPNRYASDAARKFAYACPDDAEPLAPALRRLRRYYPPDDVVRRNATSALEYITSPGESIHTVGNDDGASDEGNTRVFEDGNDATDGAPSTAIDDADSGTEIYADDEPSFNFCPNCGTDLRSLSVARFCPSCGTELER
jgi:hypothetical protein